MHRYRVAVDAERAASLEWRGLLHVLANVRRASREDPLHGVDNEVDGLRVGQSDGSPGQFDMGEPVHRRVVDDLVDERGSTWLVELKTPNAIQDRRRKRVTGVEGAREPNTSRIEPPGDGELEGSRPVRVVPLDDVYRREQWVLIQAAPSSAFGG